MRAIWWRPAGRHQTALAGKSRVGGQNVWDWRTGQRDGRTAQTVGDGVPNMPSPRDDDRRSVGYGDARRRHSLARWQRVHYPAIFCGIMGGWFWLCSRFRASEIGCAARMASAKPPALGRPLGSRTSESRQREQCPGPQWASQRHRRQHHPRTYGQANRIRNRTQCA